MKKLFLIGLMCIFLEGCATLAYKQEFTIVSALPEIFIKLEPVGQKWNAEILNNTDDPIKFLLDESSYVNPDGTAVRLIRGHSRIIQSSVSQPMIPIPPHAKFNDFLIPEDKIHWAENIYFSAIAMGEKPFSVAKFYLVFEINGEKKNWISDVKYIR